MATNTNMKYIVTDGTGKSRKGLVEYFGRTFTKVKYGLGPLWFMLSGVTVIGTYVAYRAFNKSEVYMNRSRKTAPWEWERAKYEFDQKKRILRDRPENWARIPELDALMEEMESAEKARGLK